MGGSTFKLHPLPEEALNALQASAVAVDGVDGLSIVGGLPEVDKELLTPHVLGLVRDLVRRERSFSPNLEGLMELRRAKQEQVFSNILSGRQAMTFPEETREIREGSWRSETLRPSNMDDRACENTHPSRAANMAIHGLNSSAASDFMDNEDSQAPLKASVLSGYRVIHEAVLGTIKDDRPNSKTVLKGRLTPADLQSGLGLDRPTAEATFATLQAQAVLNKHGRITDVLTRQDFVLDPQGQLPAAVDKPKLEAFLRARRPATTQVRVRGLHLFEGHVLVDGKPVSGALLDFAVFVATCHEALAEIGAQPTLYLPKMESRHETEWWAKIFGAFAEMLGIDPLTIRSTTMIETITASMEKDEMNYTLRQHSLGQNKGRYDYLFNFIKRLTLPKSQQVALLRKALQSPGEAPQLLSAYRQFLLPDNAHTTMGTSFLDAYSNHTSQVNLQRGFDSVGGMVTNIPTGDPEVDGRAKAKLRVDKTNEAWKGDAGGWSGHPAFSAAVREPFDIVRGVHKGFKVVAARKGRPALEAAIRAVRLPQEHGGQDGEFGPTLTPILALAREVKEQGGLTEAEGKALDRLGEALSQSLTLHVAKTPEVYRDGLLRFIELEPPQPPVRDVELISVPEEQHEASKFTYGGLKQYLRLALYYTASFIHGSGCIALDGVFEDLATAEKARCNVWQWLALDQEIGMPDGSRAVVTPALLNQAFDEVYALVLGEERAQWGRVCKSLPPMQPDQLDEKHFQVARRVLEVLMTNDRCVEFIPDLAYPFLLEPVRQDPALWQRLYEGLDAYRQPMDRHDAELADLRRKLKLA